MGDGAYAETIRKIQKILQIRQGKSLQNKNKVLGVLGGLGPMATVYFYEMLTEHTYAERDQDHIDIVISSRATTPDRTAFILGKSEENPLSVMCEEAKRLIGYGADMISIPCNTAHYFYDELAKEIDVPIVNIIRETVRFIKNTGAKKAGILATEGTVRSGAYEKVSSEMGLLYEAPEAEYQSLLSDIIYGDIKHGKDADMEKFGRVCSHMREKGCERIVLGCTELSLIAKKNKLGGEFVDSMEVLALKTIKMCGKTPIGFSDEMMKYIN